MPSDNLRERIAKALWDVAEAKRLGPWSQWRESDHAAAVGCYMHADAVLAVINTPETEDLMSGVPLEADRRSPPDAI